MGYQKQTIKVSGILLKKPRLPNNMPKMKKTTSKKKKTSGKRKKTKTYRT